MTNQRERWPLYCSNLDFAQHWLRGRLLNLQSPSRDLHDALSTGLIDEVKQALDDHRSIDDHLRRQILYRIALAEGNDHPYRILLGEFGYSNAVSKWNYCLENGTIDVVLNGGIGDHIQQISVIQSIEPKFDAINIFLSQNRYLQLKDLIPDRFNTSVLTRNPNLIHPFEIFAASSLPLHPTPWVAENIYLNQPKKYHYLCCWQARGVGDLYSAFNRSIGFEYVLSFYQILIRSGVQPNKILDITAWKNSELTTLERLGISHYDPASNSSAMLARVASATKTIITIDTALVHLCAALNISCLLLLCYYHDERWFQLIHSLSTLSSYSKSCKIMQQDYYGNWSSVMGHLCQITLNH